MPTLGPIVDIEPKENSLVIKKMHLFPKLTATSKEFFVLLIITLVDVPYRSFASAYKTITPIKMETLPLVWPNCWS